MDFYLLRYISFKKAFNVLKVYTGYSLSVLFKKVIVLGYPYSLTTEPTNRCNLKCLECPTGNNTSTRNKGEIDFETYKKIIDEVKDYMIYQMIYFQGEPFLNKNIYKLIKYSDQNKIYTTTSTNGHYLTKENCQKIIQSGLKKIIISLDGVNQKTLEKYRIGVNYDKIITGIQTLVEEKKQTTSRFPVIHLQFLVFNHNQHQINDFKKLAKYLKVDEIELKSAQIENFKENDWLMPSNKKFARYDQSFNIKSKLSNRCIRIWNTLVVSWDGYIVPCCFDKNLQYQIANSNKKNILAAWKNNEFNSFRKKLLNHRKKISMCNNCSEGLRIKY